MTEAIRVSVTMPLLTNPSPQVIMTCESTSQLSVAIPVIVCSDDEFGQESDDEIFIGVTTYDPRSFRC